MANWSKVTVTDKGLALLAKITARQTVPFPVTRVAFGSGAPSNLKTATALAAQIDNAEVISKIQKNNTCTLTIRFNNTNFTKAYSIREIGIFATDPDDGEILFAVMTDSTPDTIQAASASTVVTKTIVVGIGYDTSNNVTVTLSNVMWITAAEAEDIAENEVNEFAAKTYVIDDTKAAVATAEVFPAKLNELGNRLKAITGKSSWLTSPSITLEQAVKSVTRAGDTITVTMGNGSTTKFDIDNVASANSINITNNTDLVVDASGNTPSTVRVGYSATNYSGTGITEWDFYNFKGALANVKANQFVGNLKGTADYATSATTLGLSDNSTRVATTAFVQHAIRSVIDASPATLDTLNELANALGDDPNFATTMANALALKAPLNNPALTGAPTSTTPDVSDNSTRIATTAFVKSITAPLASTAYVDAKVKPLATTEYVNTQTNDKYSNIAVANATITMTTGVGNTKSITVNNVANAYTAGTANGLNFVNNNEIVFNNGFTGSVAWIGYRANDGKQNITEYKFANGLKTGALAAVTALQFNGPLKGNADTATTATNANYATTQSTSDNSKRIATTEYVKNVTAPLAATTYVDAQTNDKFKAVTGSNATLTFTKGNGTTATVTVNNVNNATNATNATNSTNATYASKLNGIYTGSGGRQAPNYFGTGKVGALMSNEAINGDSTYKNWLYMDNYTSSDAGGATAIGVSRNDARAFIMQSDSNRTAWNNTAELATVPFVNAALAALVDSSPGTLDTLNELAKALGNDPNFSTTIMNLLAQKAPLASPSFSGTPRVPTPGSSDSSNIVPNTSWVRSVINAVLSGWIVGDVSNPNAWWVKIPCKGFNLLIQGIYAVGKPEGLLYTLPVASTVFCYLPGTTNGDIALPVSAQLVNNTSVKVFSNNPDPGVGARLLFFGKA